MLRRPLTERLSSSLVGDKRSRPLPTVQCVTVGIPARTVYSAARMGGLVAKHGKSASRCSDEVSAL